MRRETQHVLLLLLGGALIKITLNGDYLRYVRPSHAWWLLTAGVVVVVLAGVGVVRDLRSASTGDTGHGGHSPWLLMLPVLAIFLVAPPALGADAAGRSSNVNVVARQSQEFAPLPDGPAPQLALTDVVARANWDRSGQLDGREITVTGFVVRRGASVQLARMAIVCCAADARPVRLRLDGTAGPAGSLDVPADTWLEVRGTVQQGSATAASDHVPVMTVHTARVVAPPPDPYVY